MDNNWSFRLEPPYSKNKKAGSSLFHNKACLDLSILGRTKIRQQLNEAFRRNVEKNKDHVRQNQ